jgi:hypothetical protein
MLAPFPDLLEDALFALFDAETWHESILFLAETLSGVFAEGVGDVSFEELHDRRLHDDGPILMKLGHTRMLLVEGHESTFEMQPAGLSSPVFLGHQLGREDDFASAVLAELVTSSTTSPTDLK